MNEKIKAKDVYLSYNLTKAPSTSDLEILGDVVKQGKVVSIETFFVIDQTTAAKTIKLGFRRGGTDYYIKRAAAGTGVYGIYLERPLILTEGERPIATVEAPTANDVCLLIARGPYLSE
jgi:hypothetical protein